MARKSLLLLGALALIQSQRVAAFSSGVAPAACPRASCCYSLDSLDVLF